MAPCLTHRIQNLAKSFWAMSRLPSLVEINCLYWNVDPPSGRLGLNPYNGYQLLALWGKISLT